MDIAHVAKLAALPLTSDEEKTFAAQMPAILGYVEQLQKIDTTSVDDSVSALGETNVLRPDVIQDCPSLISGFVKTKAIFTDHE